MSDTESPGGSGPKRPRMEDKKESMDQQQSPSGESESSDSDQASSDNEQVAPDNDQQENDNNNPNIEQPQEEVHDSTLSRKFLNQYQFYQNEKYSFLGEGSYGEVHKVHDTRNHIDVAMKKIPRGQTDQQDKYENELAILKKIANIKLENHYVVQPLSFSGKSRLNPISYMTLELMSTALSEVLDEKRNSSDSKGSFSLSEIRTLGMQIGRGLEFLATPKLKIIHADLKLDNILFTNSDRTHLKIINFSHSFKSGSRVYHPIQTENYRAPEVFLGLKPYTNTIDIWSLGTILINMHSFNDLIPDYETDRERNIMHQYVRMFGKPPDAMRKSDVICNKYFQKDANNRWKTKNPKKVAPKDIRRDIGTFIELDEKEEGSDEYYNLIVEIMNVDVSNRIKLDRIIGHKFFEDRPAPQ